MKKKYTLVLMILCFCGFSGAAQESIIPDIDYKLLDKYIKAAREYYPRRKMVEAQKDVSKVAITTSYLSYLDIFSASYFYRPNDKTPITTPGTTVNPYIVNGIQYGININLGSFLQKPFMVKRAKSEYKVATLQAEDYDVLMVTEVKKRYYTYVQMLAELKIRTLKAMDNKSVADNARRRFEKGEIPLEAYNSSRVELADASSEKLQTEVNFLNAKDALEEMIGKKLSEIN
jgi:outer membrane protein TolC